MSCARRDAAIAHVPSLDGLRGIAILLVVSLHFGVAASFPAYVPGRAAVWIERFFYTGWAGVDLFFVLSGFLITSILLASREQPRYFSRFYARRALRIFPLHYLAILVTLLVVPRVAPAMADGLIKDAARGQLWLWFYGVNIAFVTGAIEDAGMLGHFWTLAIEEQFYIVWPWFVRRRSHGTLLAASITLAVGALALRTAWLAAGGGWGGPYRFTLTRVDGFALGAAVAVAAQTAEGRQQLARWSGTTATIGLVLLGALFLAVPRFYPESPIVVTAGHALLALTSAAVIGVALQPRRLEWLAWAPLRAVGRDSYGTYVWHWPLQRIMLLQPALQPGTGLSPLSFFVAGMLGSLALGWFSHRVIERPFLALKRRFAYQPALGGKAAAAEP